MPVKKYRSLDEAERDLWMEPGDRRIWEALCRRWQVHRFFSAGGDEPKRGVFRYRSIEEKQRLLAIS